MIRLKSPYNAVILLFFILSFYIAYTAESTDYKNIFYLYTSLTLVFLGYHFSGKASSSLPQEGAFDKQYSSILAVTLVFILGAGLRFYGLNFGLPHNYHPDEIPKVNAVMRMYQQGSFDPNYFLHPSLLLYSTYFSNVLFHLFGYGGDFQESAFLAGRTVSALAGSLSVLLVYFISREIFSVRSALLASILLAVFPLHITCSRYLKEDSLLVFFILLTLFFTLLAVRKDNIRLLFISALFSGLSTSTKYSGALSFAIVAASPWLKSGNFIPDRRFLLASFISGFFCAAGFFIATPYSLLNSARFLKDVAYESKHMSQGHTTAVDGWSQYWMYHFSRSIVPGVSFVAALFALLKTGVILKRKVTKEMFIAALLFMFYLSAEYVKSKPAPQPERYILPCIPFIAILAAGFFDDLTRISRGRAVVFLFILFICFSPLKRSLELASEIKYDTRVELSDWINQNIPAGSKIMTDRKSYAPLLDDQKYEVKHLNGSSILQDLDVKNLRKSGYDYLILSSLFYSRYFTEPKVEPVARQRIRELSKYFRVVNEIRPQYGTYGFHNPTLVLYNLKSR